MSHPRSPVHRLLSSRARRRNLISRPRRSWAPEGLEPRVLLSTIAWAADVSGDWDNPAMWTGGAVPGPSDDAVIGFSDITVTHDTSASDTVDSVTCAATLDITSGSLGIDTTSPSQPTSTVSGQFNSSGGSLQLLAGTLNLSGGGTVSGSITGVAGTNLGLEGQDLTASSVISSVGSVDLIGCTEAGSFSDTGGTLAESTSFTGPVLDLGSSLEVYGTASFSPASGGPVTLTTGTLTIEDGSALTGTDSFVANGLLTLSDGSTLGPTGTVDAYGGLSIAPDTCTVIDGTTLNNHAAATWQVSPGGTTDLPHAQRRRDQQPGGRQLHGDRHRWQRQCDLARGRLGGGLQQRGDVHRLGVQRHQASDVPFANTGTVDVQQGELVLGGDGSTRQQRHVHRRRRDESGALRPGV